jgi:VanZ family protein
MTMKMIMGMSFTIKRRKPLRVIWVAVILAVIVGSLLPGNSLPLRVLQDFNIRDKILHFMAYATLSLLPALHERLETVIVASLGAVALGILLEFGQLYSIDRSFEIADMVANALGVCSGFALGLGLRGSDLLTPAGRSGKVIR